MGFRFGKRIGNTYVSTNGRNVRTTTKIGKNTYYSRQWGKSRRGKSGCSFGTVLFSLGFTVFVWNAFIGAIGCSGLKIDLRLLFMLLPDNIQAGAIAIGVAIFSFPFVMAWIFKHL